MPDALKVKQATVVHIDGRSVGVNESGATETEGPRKGRLVVERTINLRNATIHAYAEGADRSTSKVVSPAQIRPGDKISAGWAANPAGAASPTNATVVQVKDPQLPGPPAAGAPRTFTALDAITAAADGPKTADGVPLGENYPNTKASPAPLGADPDAATTRTKADKRAAGEAVDDGDVPEGADGARAGAEQDLESMTVAELRDVASAEEVDIPSGAHKADIISHIKRSRRTKK